MCHVDHNFFSPMLNVNNTNGRSYNLRTAIGTTPTSTAGYTNSDYATGGGICISCHTTELAKNRTTQKDDGTTVTVAVTDNRYPPRDSSHPNLRNHNYNVSSTMSDGSTFNANCSKCHNAKTNETTTFQSSTYKFGTHDDTARRLLAALGGTLTENYEEAFCYRCHSKATDPIGGTKKSADVNDWYGAVTNMDPKSTGIYQAFQKLGFTTATNVLYFRRSMPAGRVPTDSESTDTFQGGNWQLKEMLPTAGTSLYEDEQRFTPDNGGNSVFWKMTSFVSPPVPTTTIPLPGDGVC